VLEAIDFTSGPVIAITHIKLLGRQNADIVSFVNNSWSVALTLSNAGTAEVVDIAIYGKVITTTPTKVIKTDPAVDPAQTRTFVVDSPLIQTIPQAETYATSLLGYAKNSLLDVPLSYRGDPSLELLDVVTVDDATDALPSIDVLLLSHSLTFDGGLEAAMETKIKL
jgi:hypothetical protein